MARANIDIRLSNGKQAGQTINELRQQANRLNKEINNLKPGSDEFINASNNYNKVTARLKDVRNEVKGVKSDNAGLVQSFQQFIPFSGQLSSVANGFKAINLGLKGTRAALIATGIGAFIVILGSLFTYLTSVQSGIDKVTAVTRPLAAVFQTLKGVVQELGGSVFKGLAMILNGDIKEGLKAIGNGFVDVVGNTTKAIEQGIKAGTKLDQLQKQIQDSEIDLIKRRGDLLLISKQSNDIAEDETASLEAREAAAKKAINAQIELEKLELDFLDLKIEKMKLEQSLNDTLTVDLKELALLEEERDNKQTAIQEARTTLRNKLNTIRKAQIAQEKKEADDAANEELARQKILEQEKQAQAVRELEAFRNLQDLRILQMEEGLNREIEKIWLDTDRKIETLNGTEAQITAQRVALEEIRLKEILAVQEKYLDIEDKAKDLAFKKDIERKKTEKQNAISAAASTAGALGNIAGDLAGLQEKGSKNYKSFAVAQARISAIQAALNAYQSTAALPGGAVLAPIAATTAFAFGMKKANDIESSSLGTPIGGASGGGGFGSTSSAGVNLTRATSAPTSAATSSSQGTTTGSSNRTANSGKTGDPTERMIQAFESRISNIKVNANLQEFKDGINTIVKLEDDATL